MNRRSVGPAIIAVLSAAVAVLVPILAAPSKRITVTLVVSVPFVLATIIAARAAWHARAYRPSGPNEGTIGSLFGDPGDFIARAPELRAQFDRWALQRGLIVTTSEELLEVIWRHSEELSIQEALLPAIAAYGERIRHEIAGQWAISNILLGGEPIIVRQHRPWSRRRVALEVLDTLSSSAPSELL